MHDARATGGIGDGHSEALLVLIGDAVLLLARAGLDAVQSGTPGCHAATNEGERLVARAKQERAIKRDILFADIVCIATAVALAAPGDPTRIRRLVAMFVDGMRRA